MWRWVLLGIGLLSIQACGWCVQWGLRWNDRRPRVAERWGTAWLLGVGTVGVWVSVWTAIGGPIDAWAFRSLGIACLVASVVLLVVCRVWYKRIDGSRRQSGPVLAALVLGVAALPMAHRIPTRAAQAPPWLLHLDDTHRVGTDDVAPLARTYRHAARFPQSPLLAMVHTYLYVWMGRVAPEAVAMTLPITWLAAAALLGAKLRQHAGLHAALLGVLLMGVGLAVTVVPSARAGGGDDLIVAALWAAGLVYVWGWTHSAEGVDYRVAACLLGFSSLAGAGGLVGVGAVLIGLGVYRWRSRRRHVAKAGRTIVAMALLMLALMWVPSFFASSPCRSSGTSPGSGLPDRAPDLAWACLFGVGVVVAGSMGWQRARLRRPRNLLLATVLIGYLALAVLAGLVFPSGLAHMRLAQAGVHVLAVGAILVASLFEQDTAAGPAPPAAIHPAGPAHARPTR